VRACLGSQARTAAPQPLSAAEPTKQAGGLVKVLPPLRPRKVGWAQTPTAVWHTASEVAAVVLSGWAFSCPVWFVRFRKVGSNY